MSAAVAALTLSASTEALAAGSWQGEWKTKGHEQTTAAHHVSKGKHFLHFGVKGKHEWVARAYRVVGKKGGSNDVRMQTVKGRDTYQSTLAPMKKYPSGSFYIVFSYSVKGTQAYGGIE
ncbi:hypothetical protein ACQB60_44815 [Actinomycetota bacterium Odt1-20B]